MKTNEQMERIAAEAEAAEAMAWDAARAATKVAVAARQAARAAAEQEV